MEQSERDYFIFKSTGRKMYANCNIIGINSDLKITNGYDGNLPDFNDPEEDLTNSEKIELADYMINLWNKYRNSI